MIKLVIFDWDDVFTQHSAKAYYYCYRKALHGVGIHLPENVEDELIKAKWGAGHRAQIEYILEHQGAPELLDKVVKIYHDHFFGGDFMDQLDITPGAQVFLSDIATRYKLSVATGGHPRIMRDQFIPKFKIPDVFEQIITIYDIDDIKKAKPHPHMAEKIMELTGFTPDETVLVGDASTDVQMARSAGVEPIVVLTGQLSRAQAEALGVRHIIDDVTLLEPVLETLSRART